MLKRVSHYLFQRNKLSFLLIIIGTIVWSLLMVRSGKTDDLGMGFWGPNAHDGLWHIALSKNLARNSFENPVFAGENLKNYHIGFDMFLGYFSKMTGIDIFLLYFQLIPPITAFLIGLLVYKYVKVITRSESCSFWSVFLVYFSGSLGPIIHIIRYGRMGGDSMFWAQSSATSLVNPPFSVSLIFLLMILLILHNYRQKPTNNKLVFLSILLICISQIKIYAGIICFGAFFLVSVYHFVLHKSAKLFLVFVLSVLITFALFFPLNNGSSGLIEFSPFWFIETMMLFEDRLNWSRFYSAMTNYGLGGQYIKYIASYLTALVIFIIGNLGTRVLGFVWLKEKIKNMAKIGFDELFLINGIIIGVVTPLLFVQKGTPWNTIQFFYYSLFLFSIISGIVVGEISKKINKYFYGFLVLMVIIISLLITITTLGHYTAKHPHTIISVSELEAMEYIKGLPEGIVLDAQIKGIDYREEKYKILPIYLYESTSYISALGEKSVYFEDEINLNIMDYGWEERKEKIGKFLSNLDVAESKSFMHENDISYIYFVKTQKTKLPEIELGIDNIYENSEVILYKVR